MSVVIAVKVSEGLVLGADSAATLHGKITTPQGVQEGVLKTYFNARKLLQIGEFPIGVLTWGTSFIGSRTVESVVREWEYDNHWWSEETYHGHHSDEFAVRKCAEELCEHASRFYSDEFGELPRQDRPVIGFLVAGYSQMGFFPEVWRFVLPPDCEGQVHNQRPDQNGKPDFGASWFGATDAIVRLHFGRDEQAIGIISEKFEISRDEVTEALKPLQYQIPFPVMPLQDAIEYSNYMLNVAVGRYRHVIGSELCGGKIEIAAITQQRFEWISRKTRSLG